MWTGQLPSKIYAEFLQLNFCSLKLKTNGFVVWFKGALSRQFCYILVKTNI